MSRRSRGKDGLRQLVEGLLDGSLVRDFLRYTKAVEDGADPIEAMHGHICGLTCWHNTMSVGTVARPPGHKWSHMTPWEVLGLEEGASVLRIKEAYRAAIIMWHPDRQPESATAEEKQLADRMFVEISRAYAQLIQSHSAPKHRGSTKP